LLDHPGHLDLLDYLIQQDVLDAPYFVQIATGNAQLVERIMRIATSADRQVATPAEAR
jgi:hypothetical protein